MADLKLPWTQLDHLLPDDRRKAIEQVFSRIRSGRAGNRPEIVAMLADPESAWGLGNAICHLQELAAGQTQSVRESPAKDLADLKRRLTARREGLVEDISRARTMATGHTGIMHRVPAMLGSPGDWLEETAGRLTAALEAVEDALLRLSAAEASKQDEVPHDLPEVRFAKVFAVLLASSGGDLSGDKSGGRFRDLLRATFEACDVSVPEHRIKAAASSASEFVSDLGEGDR